jgi:hypothetical protein
MYIRPVLATVITSIAILFTASTLTLASSGNSFPGGSKASARETGTASAGSETFHALAAFLNGLPARIEPFARPALSSTRTLKLALPGMTVGKTPESPGLLNVSASRVPLLSLDELPQFHWNAAGLWRFADGDLAFFVPSRAVASEGTGSIVGLFENQIAPVTVVPESRSATLTALPLLLLCFFRFVGRQRPIDRPSAVAI